MTESQRRDAAQVLAQRLRELRTRHWPDLPVTQRDLAAALSTRSSATGPLISSWENVRKPVVPPPDRLAAYATFFATRRSLEGGQPRILESDELSADEASIRDRLAAELLALHEDAVSDQRHGSPSPPNPWHFGDTNPVTIVCGEVSQAQREIQAEAIPEHPTLASGRMYTYADIDTLFEVHGEVRAANPASKVDIVQWKDVNAADLRAHVVVVGRGDRGPMWQRVEARTPAPIRYGNLAEDLSQQYIEVENGQRYGLEFDGSGHLLADIGLFFRGPNPFDAQHTLTICHGMFATGTFSVARSLTDAVLGPANIAFLDVDRANRQASCFLVRISVIEGVPLIPEWEQACLYEWREAS